MRFAPRGKPALCVMVLLCLALSHCEPRGKLRPPESKEKDPTLITVADTALTIDFVKYALSNLPLLLRGRFMNEEGQKEFIERQIDAMAYYHEGRRRKIDKSRDYLNRIYLTQRLTLIHMAKDRAYDASAPLDPAESAKAYEHYSAKEKSAGREPKPLAEVESSLSRSLEAGRYRRAFKTLVETLKKEYDLKLNQDALDKPFRELKLDMAVVESRAFNLTVMDFLQWIKSLPENFQKQLATVPGRKFLVDYYVENELLYYDALVRKLDKTEEYKTRVFVMEVNILGKMTADAITKQNILATTKEAREYYKKYKDKFGGRDFSQVRESAIRKAGADKRARITRELAFALRRDRYPVRYFEDRIKELDLSLVTKGEMGLMAFPVVPPDAPPVDIDGILNAKTSMDQ